MKLKVSDFLLDNRLSSNAVYFVVRQSFTLVNIKNFFFMCIAVFTVTVRYPVKRRNPNPSVRCSKEVPAPHIFQTNISMSPQGLNKDWERKGLLVSVNDMLGTKSNTPLLFWSVRLSVIPHEKASCIIKVHVGRCRKRECYNKKHWTDLSCHKL